MFVKRSKDRNNYYSMSSYKKEFKTKRAPNKGALNILSSISIRNL